MASTFDRLQALDAVAMTPLVRRLLGDPLASAESVAIHPFAKGYAAITVGGAGTFRVSGTADGGRGWSLVLKVLGHTEGAGSTNPRAWNYWKREILAYQSGMLDVLPGGIAAPRCFGVVEQPRDEFWIWLEEVPPPGDWSLETYARTARHIGRSNGAYLTGAAAIPDYPWMTRGRVHEWLELSTEALSDLPAHLASRTRRHWLSAAQTARVIKLYALREKLLAAFDRLPRCLCHHDAFQRNLFPGTGSTIAIDWSIAGTGVVGEDLMPLCAVTAQFMNIPAGGARALADAAYPAYLAGLREAGWPGDARLVRFGFTTAMALFAGVAEIGMWESLSNAERCHTSEEIIGHPIDEIIDTWAILQDQYLDLGDEALALLDEVESAL